MPKDISITEARQEITALPERLAKEPGAVAVTRRGKPVLAIMPWDLYESIIETLEILPYDQKDSCPPALCGILNHHRFSVTCRTGL